MCKSQQFQVFDRDGARDQSKGIFSNFLENHCIPGLSKKQKTEILNRSSWRVLTIETENCHPGFARLLLKREPSLNFAFLNDIFVIYNGKKICKFN